MPYTYEISGELEAALRDAAMNALKPGQEPSPGHKRILLEEAALAVCHAIIDSGSKTIPINDPFFVQFREPSYEEKMAYLIHHRAWPARWGNEPTRADGWKESWGPKPPEVDPKS
jgi:hypothetical protein